jgi:hypothetical protein
MVPEHDIAGSADDLRGRDRLADLFQLRLSILRIL